VDIIKKFKLRNAKFKLCKFKLCKFYIVFLLIVILSAISIYIINELITPAIVTAADIETRAKIAETINYVIINEYSEKFNYDSIINVEKDKDGNISMIKADTLKMNKIACDVAMKSQAQLRKIGEIGLKIPLGYIFKNNLLAFMGPIINVKMQPIGYIETKYLSDFQSVGINQARHKIYVQVKTNMRIIVPFNSKNIEVTNEVPISETIIVGKVPGTSINMGLDNAGFKLPNSK
jgi:sporulation protein YunB